MLDETTLGKESLYICMKSIGYASIVVHVYNIPFFFYSD